MDGGCIRGHEKGNRGNGGGGWAEQQPPQRGAPWAGQIYPRPAILSPLARVGHGRDWRLTRGSLTSGEALRLPPTAPEKAPPLAHAHSRSRSRALAPPAPARAPPTGLWPAPALSVSVRESQSGLTECPAPVTWPGEPITKLPSAAPAPMSLGVRLLQSCAGARRAQRAESLFSGAK